MSVALLLALYVVGVNSDDIAPTPSIHACPSLPPVLNGEVKFHCSGQKAVYKCDEGYSLHGGSEQRYCMPREQQWSGTAPECVQDGQWGGWTEWTPCSTTCGEGESKRRRLCNNPTPSLYGKDCVGSSVENRLCISEACSKCDVKELLHISLRIADDGETAKLTCPVGFVPQGEVTRTCDPATGNWENNLFSGLPCRKICSPLDPLENGFFIKRNDSVVYFCNKGFQLIGSSKRQCVNGIWTGARPSCVEVGDISEVLENLIGVNPVLPLTNGTYVVNSEVFYMAAAKKRSTTPSPSENTTSTPSLNTASPVPTTGTNVSSVNDTIQLIPALRSISFYYRIPEGKGNVSVIARLLNLRDNATVATSESRHLQASVYSILTLTPVCIPLSSNLEKSFRSRIQLEITVPTGTLFEMRMIETNIERSLNNICETRSGQCPEVSDTTTSRCGLYCRHDGSCPNRMKCCSTSCGGVDCLNPINASHVTRRAAADEDDEEYSCDNDTSSGDCGFKNTVCTGESGWDLVHGDPENPEETNQLPFTSSPGNECSMDVCLECLFPSPLDVTDVSSLANNDNENERRKRTLTLVGRSAFCLFPRGKRRFNYGTMPTVRVSSQNTKLEFFVDMFQGGKHHMSVWLRCTSDDRVKIHLGEKRSPSTHRAYHIPHFKNTGIHDVYEISDIKSMIDRQFHTHTDCLEYYVEFQVVVFKKPACVSSIFFRKK